MTTNPTPDHDEDLIRRVLELRFGAEKPLSRVKVAAELGISVGKVRGIEDRALTNLRSFSRGMRTIAALIEILNPRALAEIDEYSRRMQVLLDVLSGRILADPGESLAEVRDDER